MDGNLWTVPAVLAPIRNPINKDEDVGCIGLQLQYFLRKCVPVFLRHTHVQNVSGCSPKNDAIKKKMDGKTFASAQFRRD